MPAIVAPAPPRRLNTFKARLRRRRTWAGSAPAVLPTAWTVGLLSTAPDPDGMGHVELQTEGYQRQMLDPIPREPTGGLKRLFNAHRLCFGPVTPAWPKFGHVGVFDAQGDLVGATFLEPCGSSQFRDWIDIRPFDLTITFA